MKVFVYTKDKKSQHIATIKNVRCVTESKNNKISIMCYDLELIEFDTTKVKTRIYQN